MQLATASDAFFSALTQDSLFHLQLQVARRADEFAHLCSTSGSTSRDREMWQQAEAECLRRMDFSPLTPPAPTRSTPAQATLQFSFAAGGRS